MSAKSPSNDPPRLGPGPDAHALQRRIAPALKVLLAPGHTHQSMLRNGRLVDGAQLRKKPYTRADVAAMLRRLLD
jgi:hypothetical protein